MIPDSSALTARAISATYAITNVTAIAGAADIAVSGRFNHTAVHNATSGLSIPLSTTHARESGKILRFTMIVGRSPR